MTYFGNLVFGNFVTLVAHDFLYNVFCLQGKNEK